MNASISTGCLVVALAAAARLARSRCAGAAVARRLPASSVERSARAVRSATPPVRVPVPAAAVGAAVRAGLSEAAVEQWWRRWLLATGSTVAMVPVVGPVIAVAASVVLVAAPVGTLAVLAARRRRRVEAELPVILSAAASGLRAGASLAEALDQAGRHAPVLGAELAPVLRSVERGAPLADELGRWSVDHAVAGSRLATAALALAAQAGGSQARALDGVAATLRDRQAVHQEVGALASQARASAVLLMALPVVFACFTLVGDPRTSQVMLHRPVGWVCIGTGLVLDAVGAWWMQRLTAGLS